MRHIFVINPAAGKKDSSVAVYSMVEKLKKNHNVNAECILTKRQGHATELARELCQTGEELRFYACGGDGTINEVANGIIGYDNAAMTCIPIGTGNDFLKNFGEKAALFADAENLWDSPVFDMDAIQVNDKIALTIACSGIDARVAQDVHKYGESPLFTGKGSYIASLVVNFFFKGISSHWTVTLDDEKITGDFAIVTACNGRYYGGGFMPMPEARMDDGIMNVLVVDKISRLKFASIVPHYSKGLYREFTDIAHPYTPKVIKIHSEQPDIVTCLDGECYTSTDIEVKIHESKVHFFGPKGCDCNATAANID